MVDETHDKWDADAMLDALPERVIRYRLPDLTILYCNTAWAAQYKLEPAQTIGTPLHEFLTDDGLAGLTSQLALLGPDNFLLDPSPHLDYISPTVERSLGYPPSFFLDDFSVDDDCHRLEIACGEASCLLGT